MIASITELHLKGFKSVPAFVRHSQWSMQQAQQSKGLQFATARFGWLKAYTLTVWESEADMLQFRNSGAHLEAMKQLKFLAKAYRTSHFEVNNKPGWKQALKVLQQKELVYFK